MRLSLFASMIVAALAGACGHVPLSSLPKLSRIDMRSTTLTDLRAAISLPSDIRPLPGGVTMTIVIKPRDGGRHERKVVLEEVRDATELAALPVMASPGRRLTVFRLSAADATKLSVFREELLVGAGNSGNRGSLALRADKACHTGELGDEPILMTTYLKTSETQDYIVVARDLNLREAVRAADPKIDLAVAIPPCDP
ncbi:Hypothetical protein precursor [Bosea sp. LC85]|uniref:hypothetical protein n=1 Tax=Bosea sp. LC85 TaxID=1502851 RepID=UPI0004E3A164|nr:hypothetical protein [Bosea sp. LC85]KFC67115.1 Hypothetical protein precursor [Bosea sp. LC85]